MSDRPAPFQFACTYDIQRDRFDYAVVERDCPVSPPVELLPYWLEPLGDETVEDLLSRMRVIRREALK